MGENNIIYSKLEERFNIWTHFAGTVLAFFGVVLLAIKAYFANITGAKFAAIVVYGVCLILLFSISTIYHAMPQDSIKRVVFRRLDHCSIAILIAGTYAPYMILGLGGVLGSMIEIIELVLCVLVVVLNAINVQKFRIFSLIAYIVMGWLCMFAVIPLYKNIGFNIFFWMMLGGVLFTVGVIFYKKKSIKFNHAIWHFFVLCAAIFMWISVYFLVSRQS